MPDGDPTGEEKTFAGKIGELFADLVSLDVATFTGDVTLKAKIADQNSETAPKKFDLTELFQNLQDQTGDADLRLVAFTHIAFDKDAVNFVASDLTPAETGLVTAHKEMVTASIEGRIAMVEAVTGFIKPRLG